MSERATEPGTFAARTLSPETPAKSTAAPTVEGTVAKPWRTYRGRLFRRYLLHILTLVTGALLASGAISLYFTYQENKAALASLQHEKALAAASRIAQYIGQIERELAYAALPQLDASDVEVRRIEFLKLLRQAPEVTDIALLDATGREQIAVSRLGMDNIGSGKDRSQEPAFRGAKRGAPWFGPVYFRKETEPYMTVALRSSDNGPVTVAEVNLKFIWDVVSRIKIGDKGKAYVVGGSDRIVALERVRRAAGCRSLQEAQRLDRAHRAVVAGGACDLGARRAGARPRHGAADPHARRGRAAHRRGRPR